jgi:ribosome biogenesis GTPase A
LRAGKDLELLDNPGILWPRFESESVGKLLALVGSIKAELVPYEEVSLFGIKLLQTKYPDRLQKRYNLDPSLKDPVMILEAIGKNRGCLLQEGLIDFERAAKLFLFDLQNQMFGQLTLEGIEANVSI